MAIFSLILVLSSIGECFNQAQDMSVKKDWIVVLSQDNENRQDGPKNEAQISSDLAAFNTFMRRYGVAIYPHCACIYDFHSL